MAVLWETIFLTALLLHLTKKKKKKIVCRAEHEANVGRQALARWGSFVAERKDRRERFGVIMQRIDARRALLAWRAFVSEAREERSRLDDAYAEVRASALFRLWLAPFSR